MHPRRIERAIAWELRGAWASRREVVVVLMPAADRPRRLRGYVQRVAATDAYALVWDGVAEAHVPLALVLAVRSPHFSAPEDGDPVGPPPVRVVRALLEGQLSLF